MIYFQVLDRTIRTFLNDLMPRFPFQAGAGETPPGLTDALIFYDPLVKPTRPGHILPAKFLTLLEEGRLRDAEEMLVGVILEAASAARVEHDGEIDMLTVEEEEHRVRLRDIEQRRKLLADVCDRMAATMDVLKEWKPKAGAAGEPATAVPVESAAESVPPPADSADSFFSAQLQPRIQAIMDGNGGSLQSEDINESFRLHVDLGLNVSVNPADARRALSAGGNRGVWHISDWLIHQFSEEYHLPKIKEMNEALTVIRSDLADLKSRFARLQQKRRDVLNAAGANMDRDLDALVQAQYRYFELEARRRKATFTMDEKSQIERLKEEFVDIERKVDSEMYLRFSFSPEFFSSFRRLDQAIVQSLQELVRLEEDERSKQDAFERLSEDYRRSTSEERWRRMEDNIRHIRQFSKLVSDRARRRPFAPVTPPPWPATESAVLAVLDRIASQDTTLFPEKFLRRRGPPGILLLPSFGSGLYDWKGGFLVVSLYPDRLETAVLAALAEFRMDADESKELFNSYSMHIKRNRNLGFVKLKEMFITDYTAWIEKEAVGYRVMEREVRTWFERKIPLRNSDREAS